MVKIIIHLLLFCAVLSTTAHANRLETESIKSEATGHQNTRYENNSTQSEVSEELFVRNQWKLNEIEWQRYKLLMKGIRGSISPNNLSPIEVLGTHARNDEERDKYAKIWAKAMFEDAQRVVAFQHAYDKAHKELYGHINVIDTKRLGLPDRQPNKLKDKDRVLVFIKLKSCPVCDTLVSKLLSQTQSLDLQIDIFFVDTKNNIDDKKIRAWATKHITDHKRIKMGKITLNYDNGKLYQLTKKLLTDVPVAFKTDHKETAQLFI
jgi:integrating conjugative element protein (TIGR03759 family)